ncbi:ester cyclase [Nonomuraea wenchangensis]|uniref:ester cyclase n=1 Tax=Nonomuraea wenchangensis TaxID=568860 RepID=UPI00384C942E
MRYGHPGFLRAYGEAWSSGDEHLLSRFLTEDAQYLEAGMGVDYIGREHVLRFFRFMLKFSSDSLVEFTDAIHADGAFAAEWTWSGVADGPLRLGERLLPATGHRYSVRGVALCRVTPEGLVSYHKDVYNVLELLEQLGTGQLGIGTTA